MTTIDNLKELERDMRKQTHNLIASNYLSLEDLCECIEALEKQIPKKPIRNTGQINKAWIEQVALCPTCKEYVGSYDCRIFNKFCQYCGQPIEPIDWSDEE